MVLVIKDYGASSGDTTLREAGSPERARSAHRVRQRVHRQARADRAVQVVRRLRLGASRRRLRHEDPRCDGVRAAGHHAAVRRADGLLHARQLLSGRASRSCRWATASIRGRCRSPTSRMWAEAESAEPAASRCGASTSDRDAAAALGAARPRRRCSSDSPGTALRATLVEIAGDASRRASQGRARAGRNHVNPGRALSLLARPARQRRRADPQPKGEAAGVPRRAGAPVDPAAGVRSRRRRRRIDRRHRRSGCEAVDFPFALRYFRQEEGPGAARNLGIEQAAGELVLFIGDDILADERLLEEHLLGARGRPAPGAAILGHIDWPDAMHAERGDGLRVRRRDAAVRVHAASRRCRRSTTASSTPATSR